MRLLTVKRTEGAGALNLCVERLAIVRPCPPRLGLPRDNRLNEFAPGGLFLRRTGWYSCVWDTIPTNLYSVATVHVQRSCVLVFAGRLTEKYYSTMHAYLGTSGLLIVLSLLKENPRKYQVYALPCPLGVLYEEGPWDRGEIRPVR